MGAKILVTGGAGFIGSHVAEELIRMGHRVIVLDDLSGGNPVNVPPGAKLEVGTILDRPLVTSLFQTYHFEYVFHLAAYAAEGLSHFIKQFNYQNNLIGSTNLINASVNYGVKCFIFTSSIAVYGSAPLPLIESTKPQPKDPYGIAKYAVEMELQVTREMFGLEYIIFRPHNVYGERQNIGDKYRNVIGIFFNQIMQGGPMTIFGDGSQTRAFSYISDVAPTIAHSIEVPEARNRIFNIGAELPYTLNDLARKVAQSMGVISRVEYLPARNEVQHASSEHGEGRRVFGYHSAVPLEEGLGRMARWCQEVGPRESQPFEGIEIFTNLPPSWLEINRPEGRYVAG